MKMQQHFKLTFIWAAVLVLSLFRAVTTAGQCHHPPIKLEHLSGTISFGCTDVTVTSDGDAIVGPWSACGFGPYRAGLSEPGSFTFTFSAPVEGVTIEVQGIDNHPGFAVEEMVLDVNGVFYPLTSPGVYGGCLDPAIIWPPGTLRGTIGTNSGSAKDINIPGPIYSIKVADNFVEGSPIGICFGLYFCCLCETNAGIIDGTDIETCIDEPAGVPPATQVVLDANDILQYILFSDIGNPTTSILATSSTPSFNFNPATMALGATYYIAAIAGSELNSNVDSADPCWDISNVIEVVWWPEPTVTFASDVECLHADGFYDINISFIGTPPFHLTGQVVLGGNVIATFDNTYSFFSEVLEVYLPPTTPNGSLTIEALSLSDAHCTCN